ncbi:YdeI/OmpD-associated family protein [Chitinophaga sp. XS-30]|uniref:YdeI/OmpD-associated family protein n=1 Tax=Chitinophaga sp. XS-30 TaxID=2604421 RepID=UPI0011DD9A03|nr:YdeI/OmpD-associated family protein [Chitinophaga sp. XS-30]QEH40494.1 YdeI/OmpD-associated family protein [Chitinophaga sp. XS-30]
MKKDFSSLKRPRYPMPDFIAEALTRNKLYEKYEKRPPYQQNDYIFWISSAKREETRQKRLNQMLDELREGGKYMNMVYRGE